MSPDFDEASIATEDYASSSSPEKSSVKSLLKGNADAPADGCLEVDCLQSQVCAMSCADTNSKSNLRSKYFCCGSICQCLWGVFLLLFGVTSFFYTPLDVMLREKLNMRPGMPPYEWWADPPDEVILRVYVFNVTNHERFASGLDSKLNYEEIGPIVYLEKLTHHDIRFNENSTLSYTAKRTAIFLPEKNHIDLNSTIIAPNLAVLGMSSYLHDATMFVRSAFRFLVSSHGSKMFLKRTVHEYLWDYREPVLDTSRSLAPGLVPVNNMGMLSRIYSKAVENVTVSIGPRWGNKHFFQITRVDGHPQLPGFDPQTCSDRLSGSTEGVMYHQYLEKSDVLLYWRKSVCKPMPLYFDSETVVDSVPIYRYNLSENVYDRLVNGSDCYDTVPSLPAGLSDGSKCYYDFPMVLSYPHFYTGSPPPDQFVTGMTPDRLKHNSYVEVEPMTGTPFRQVARMQSNLRIHDLSGFTYEYQRFSKLVLPLFWAEYNQEGLPPLIRGTIYFMVVVLPPLSIALSTLSLVLGSYLFAKPIYVHNLRNKSLSNLLPTFRNNNANALTTNKVFAYERELFLNKT